MNRQIRFNKAKPGKSVDSNFSEVGSIEAENFTAWEEQQTGKTPEKQRTATTDIARGGSFKKKQRPTTRMNKPFRRQSQFTGRSKKHRIFQMIRETQAQKLNFMLENGEGNQLNIPDGLYGWKGKRLKMLQSFKPVDAHKVDWMGQALGRLVKKSGPFEKIFFRGLDRIIQQGNR